MGHQRFQDVDHQRWQGNWYFVLAKTDSNAKAAKSMTGFVVDADTPVFTSARRRSTWVSVALILPDHLRERRCAEENILGKPGDGFKTAMGAFDITRPLVAAGAVGVAQRALYEAATYAQTRKTMGKQIIDHQAIAFLLADMQMNVEAARNLVWKSCWAKDNGQRNSFWASMAKCRASEAATFNAAAAVQIFGGLGFNTESPVEKLYRDARIFEIYEVCIIDSLHSRLAFATWSDKRLVTDMASSSFLFALVFAKLFQNVRARHKSSVLSSPDTSRSSLLSKESIDDRVKTIVRRDDGVARNCVF